MKTLHSNINKKNQINRLFSTLENCSYKHFKIAPSPHTPNDGIPESSSTISQYSSHHSFFYWPFPPNSYITICAWLQTMSWSHCKRAHAREWESAMYLLQISLSAACKSMKTIFNPSMQTAALWWKNCIKRNVILVCCAVFFARSSNQLAKDYFSHSLSNKCNSIF